MKLLLFVALIALAACTSVYEKDGLINFDVDMHQDSPIGFAMKGQINPADDSQNSIGTFLKLANQYIPILEEFSEKTNKLSWDQRWHIDLPGFDLTFYLYFELLIGWTVQPGTVGADSYEVTYTPFAFGSTLGRFNGTTLPGHGYFRAGLRYLDFEMPIALTIYRDARICFDTFYTVSPVTLSVTFGLGLIECVREILDDVLNNRAITLLCSPVESVDVDLVDQDFTNRIERVIVGETCVGGGLL